MLSYLQSSFLIILALVVSVVMVAVLNRVWADIPSQSDE
jgi:hypothetical protein